MTQIIDRTRKNCGTSVANDQYIIHIYVDKDMVIDPPSMQAKSQLLAVDQTKT